MKKRIAGVLLALVLALGLLPAQALADDGLTAYVTVSYAGALVEKGSRALCAVPVSLSAGAADRDALAAAVQSCGFTFGASDSDFFVAEGGYLSRYAGCPGTLGSAVFADGKERASGSLTGAVTNGEHLDVILFDYGTDYAGTPAGELFFTGEDGAYLAAKTVHPGWSFSLGCAERAYAPASYSYGDAQTVSDAQVQFYTRGEDGSYTQTSSPFAAPGTVWAVAVKDGCAPAAAVITVADGSESNTPPALRGAAQASAACYVGQPYALDLTGIFRDEDGDALNYTVSIDGGAAAAAPAAYTYVPAAAGVVTLAFSARDSQAASPAYTVTLTISSAPQPADVLAAMKTYYAARLGAEGFAFSGGSDDWALLDLIACGWTVPADIKQAFIDHAVGVLAQPQTSSADRARCILGLTALGCDARQLVTYSGAALDAAGALAQASAGEKSIYTIPYVLLALQQFGDAYASQCQSLRDKLLAAQLSGGGWGWSTSADADATGPVLLALAPYAAQKEVRTALDRALALLPGLCDSTGAVASAWGTGACSTGVLLPGVAALGETTGSYAAGLALLYQPGKRFAAYDGDTLSDEQGFRGLAAAAGASAGAYRLYDFSGTALTAARASAPTYCPVRFSVVPDGAAVTVSAGGQSVSPVGGIYDLPAGEYTYAVSRDGFVTRTGSVSVTAADAAGHTEKVLSVSLTSKPSQGGESLRVQVRVEMHPAGGAEGTYTYRHDASAYTALAARSVTLSRGSTVFDALDASGAAYHEKSWGYIDSIGGVEERQYGPNSGWMFLLNGTAGTESCRTARLSDGDQVVWFYTDDYTRDYGSESWSSASGTGSAGTVITVTAASPAVTARQAAQAAAALPASGGSITVSAPGCTAVSLPVKTAGELAAKTGAGWTAVLSGGRVTLPAKALQALAAQASGDELTLFVHKESASVFQVKLTCGGREIKDLGAAALTAELPADGDFSGARNCRVAVRTASGRTSFVIGSVESIGGAAFVCLSLTQSAQVTITGEALGAAPFPDTAGHWAEPSVNAIFARGVLGGVSLTAFGPDRPMTRAMAVTALWRLAGEPAAPADGDFSDLTGAWCAAAARWARAQGVANGYGDGSFRPDAAVARQELAAMLCRYAGAPAAGGKLAFADAGTAAPWALPALTWAVSEGYLTGVTPAELDPRGQVTRAQAAVILERFCEKTA